MDRINSYIDEWKRKREDETSFKEFVKSFTPESFLSFIMKINKDLRNIEDKNILSDGVIAGELVATTKQVREETIRQLIEYLNEEEDMKAAGTLIYSLIINFHMFGDGNGRTARFIYDLFSNQLDDSKFIYYFHKEDDTYYDGKGNFEAERGLLDLSYVNWITNSFLKHDLEDILNRYPELDGKNIVCGIGGFYADAQKRMKAFFKENFHLDLTEAEYDELVQLLCDNGGVRYTPSGIGMLLVSLEKGDIEEWIKRNQEAIERCKNDKSIYRTVSERMMFSVKKSKDLLQNWTSDDFRKVIDYANKSKQRQLTHLIEIFKNPDNYSYDETLSLKDYFTDEKSVNNVVNKSL